MAEVSVQQSEPTVDDLERQAVYDQDPRRFQTKENAFLPWSYKLMKNLLWIKSSNTDPVYKEALEEWERKSKLFTSRIERKSKQSGALQNEIYNLIGFYSVFQGVVLSAVSQSQPTVLQCRKFWIPVALSVLASAVTFLGIAQKHSEIKELKATIQKDTDCLKELSKLEWALRKHGPSFRFARLLENKKSKEREKSWASWNKFVFVWITLVLFAVVLPIFHWVLLCK